jgi:hypothetical protein
MKNSTVNRIAVLSALSDDGIAHKMVNSAITWKKSCYDFLLLTSDKR